MKKIQGQSLNDVVQLVKDYFSIIDNTEGVNQDEELTAFVAAKDFPGRVKCATLAWEALGVFFEK